MKRLFAIFIVLAISCTPLFSQKKETYRVRTVVIDPGHGGAKPGAQGSRSWEKNITLAVAKKFGKLIEDNYKDVKVIYTRTNDADISLGERARIANRNNADLFISIHANSHPTSTPTGVETFVMGLSESKANLEVAKKENADILLEADYKTNADYKDFDPNSPESWVVLTLYQNEFINKSLNLAQSIQTQYKSNLKTINRGVKQAELFVLYKTTCPSVLTEIGFISNPNEEAFMLSDEGQAKIAICLFNAFMTYKATEEGSNKPTNPVINIPGGNIETTMVDKAETKTEPDRKPEPVVAEVDAQPKAEPVNEEPKSEPVMEEPSEKSMEEISMMEINAAPQEKPTPTVELPKQETKPEVQQTAKVESENTLEAGVKPISEAKPTPEANPVAERETLRAPENTAAADAQQYYTVQFMTANTRYTVGAPQLGGISDFQIVTKGRILAYTTGRFATFSEAAEYCDYVKRATSFGDAWAYLYKVPAQKQNQPAAQANPSSQQPSSAQTQKLSSKPMSKGISYRIQFCSARKVMKVGDPKLHGITDFRYAKAGKLYIYTTGNFSNVADAQRRCDEIHKTTPFKDAFVFAVYKGERISLEQAAELEK